tara:strand:+ start:2909 stop:3148 length:240 start_codon:yes stop_codon:yes gene_type:complete
MIESLLKIFEAGLSIWQTAQSRKYQKAVLDLKEKRAKELEKEHPDHNIVDRCERELCWLAELASTEIKGQAFKDLQGGG